MCRPRDDLEVPRRRSLKIESIEFLLKKEEAESVEFLLKKHCAGVEEAEWVSLVLMPRIDGSPVVVNGSKTAGDIPTFITLDRVKNTEEEAVFRSSRERVEGWCDGLSFEVHFGQHCLVSGIFRSYNFKDWKMECKWVGKPEIGRILGIREAVMSVGVDRDEYSVLSDRVVVDIYRRRKRCGSCLPDIPELDGEDDDEDDNTQCHCNEDNEDYTSLMEDYRWAVDASFWAICVGLGLGFMASRTSTKPLRLSKFLPL